MKGIIFDIQRFAVHDGPGIRTTVFLKGCSARCEWCHNPESLSVEAQLQFYNDRCINCGKCTELCPNKAHSVNAGVHAIDRKRCTMCGLCAAECFSNALQISGREEDAEEILRQILDDKPYYDQSGGGVTLSGGEPVLQGDFCESLLARCKHEGLHTVIQTAGFYPYEKLARLLPYLDLVMYDIKGLFQGIYNHIHADPGLAAENLKRLDETGVPVIVRTPCIKGVNDSPDEIKAIAGMLSGLKHLLYYTLIPYHGLAKIKYDILGQKFRPYEAPSKDHIKMLEDCAEQFVEVKRN